MTLSVYEIAVYVCACIAIISTAIVLFKIAIDIGRYLKAKAMMMKYQIEMETDTSAFENELDAVILDCLNQYDILNIAYRSDIVYINDALEASIRTAVAEMVSERLTDHFIAKLSLIYNQSAITEIVGKRIYLAVMNYILDFNKGKTPQP